MFPKKLNEENKNNSFMMHDYQSKRMILQKDNIFDLNMDQLESKSTILRNRVNTDYITMHKNILIIY